MAEKPLLVGLIGAGQVAQVAHIPAWQQLRPAAQLVAVCDEDKARLGAVAQKFGISRAVADFEEILRDKSIAAVDICTPNHLHAPMAIAALRAGKHVLCERPMARNGREAETMTKAAEKAGLTLMVAMNNRFHDDAAILRRFIDKGELGNLFYMKTGWLRRGGSYGWKAEREMSGGGAVLDLGVQMLDVATWLAGDRKVATVSAQIHHPRPGSVEDAAVALIRMTGGLAFTVEVSWSLTIERDVAYLHAFGTRGAATLSPLRIHKELRGNLMDVTPAVASPKNLFKYSYDREISHFVDCIQNGAKQISPGVDGLEVMRITDAIYASAQSGREVALA